jgi:hypothetical protein
MSYILANGKEITIGRESHTGLLQFLLPEDGGQLPSLLSGKFTAQKFVDEAWSQYRSKTSNLRTAHPLSETRVEKEVSSAFAETLPTEPVEAKKERPPLRYKKPKVKKEVKSKDA